MPFAVQLFIICLVVGLILLGAEIFMPGGVLGLVGGIALLCAVILGFIAFPTAYGIYIAMGILFLVGLAIYLWIKFFPSSSIGKSMTVMQNMASSKATEDGLNELVGKEGKTLSDLRPGGFAVIDGKRIDVISQGGMITKGASVRVVEVEGNRVVVRTVEKSE